MEDHDKNKAWIFALENMNPNDWVNIPSLLRGAILLIKDSILKQISDQVSIEHNMMLSIGGTNKKLEILENSMSQMKNTIKDNDEIAHLRIKELNDILSSDISLFKETFLRDIDYKLKSTDKKILIFEESVFSIKKIVNQLMTAGEIERLIDSVAKETKNSTKKEIYEAILTPELTKIKEKIDFLEQNQERMRSNNEEKHLITEKALKDTQTSLLHSLKKLEDHIILQYEQQSKDLIVLDNKIKTIKQDISCNETQYSDTTKQIKGHLDKSFRYTQSLEDKIHGLKEEIDKLKDITANMQTVTENIQKKIQSQEHPKKTKPRASVDKKDNMKVGNKPDNSFYSQNTENNGHKEEVKKEEVRKEEIKKLGSFKDEGRREENKKESRKEEIRKDDLRKLDNLKEEVKKENVKKGDNIKEDSKESEVVKEDFKKEDGKKIESPRNASNKEKVKKPESPKEEFKLSEISKEDPKKTEIIVKDEPKKIEITEELKKDLPKREVHRKDKIIEYGPKPNNLASEYPPTTEDHLQILPREEPIKHLPKPNTHNAELINSRSHSPYSRGLSKDPSTFSSEFEEKFNRELNEHIIPLEKSLRIAKMEMEFSIHELKEKLSWLPMNLSEIKGKEPSEARLYAIEARQRQEENTRGEQFSHIISLLSQLRNDLSANGQTQSISTNLPQIHTGRNSIKSSERRLSVDPLVNSDPIKSFFESDSKIKYINSPEASKIKTLHNPPERKLTLTSTSSIKAQFQRKFTLDSSVN